MPDHDPAPVPPGDDQPDISRWRLDDQYKLFASMIERAHRDPEFAARCTDTPETAKEAAREEARRIGLDVEIPGKDVIYFTPERTADYCHIFSLVPEGGVAPTAITLNSYLKCCYPLYRNPPSVDAG